MDGVMDGRMNGRQKKQGRKKEKVTDDKKTIKTKNSFTSTAGSDVSRRLGSVQKEERESFKGCLQK